MNGPVGSKSLSLEEAGRLGRFFSIKKSYFLQVKSIILVGTLEKYQFFILMIPKAFLICVVGYGTQRLASIGARRVLMLLFDRFFLRKRVAQSTRHRILLKMKVEDLT